MLISICRESVGVYNLAWGGAKSSFHFAIRHFLWALTPKYVWAIYIANPG
jgi:hypothetical protein